MVEIYPASLPWKRAPPGSDGPSSTRMAGPTMTKKSPAPSTSSHPSPSRHPPPRPSKGIGPGLIVAIVLASLIGLVLLAGIGVFFRRRRRAKKAGKGGDDLLAPPKSPVMNGSSERPNMFAPSPQQEGSTGTQIGSLISGPEPTASHPAESLSALIIPDTQGNSSSLSSDNAYGYYGSSQNPSTSQVTGCSEPVSDTGNPKHPTSAARDPARVTNPDPDMIPNQQSSMIPLHAVVEESDPILHSTHNSGRESAPPPYEG